ncbi:MAG: hypothetical protein E7392_05565, partial [Ruminococcaceae bacterium]|nr:hypothetical protein [Oscillospiraceae bacterium]
DCPLDTLISTTLPGMGDLTAVPPAGAAAGAGAGDAAGAGAAAAGAATGAGAAITGAELDAPTSSTSTSYEVPFTLTINFLMTIILLRFCYQELRGDQPYSIRRPVFFCMNEF